MHPLTMGDGCTVTEISVQVRHVAIRSGTPFAAVRAHPDPSTAGLYAPLRVILYEDETGGSAFDFDEPLTLFGQFNDEQVAAVARGLDAARERALRQALEAA